MIFRYEISLKLNAVHAAVNPEFKSSWCKELFKQVNLLMHLNLSFMDNCEVIDSSGIHQSRQLTITLSNPKAPVSSSEALDMEV